MSSKLMFKIVSFFTIVALVFQSCASGSYWSKVDKKEVVDRSVIKRYEYRLTSLRRPSKQNPVGEFRLEQRPIYGSKIISKEQKTVQKSDPQLIAWGLLGFLGAGSSIVGLFVVDDVEPVGPVVTAALLGGLGYWSLKVGIKGKTKKTSEFRRQEEVGYREIEGAWGSSEVSGKVWLESPFLPRSVDRPVRNGIMSVDYVADLGIGLNEPIQNQPIKFRIYNNQLGINEEFRAHPSKFLQPHLEITKQVDNIRSGPGVNYNIIQKCLRGDLYAVKGKSGNWLKVELRNRTAWTHNSIGRIVYA